MGCGKWVVVDEAVNRRCPRLLALRYDRALDMSDLVVLDARDFGGDPVAVVRRRVPVGLHGSWVPD